jgi:hypothetical protein
MRRTAFVTFIGKRRAYRTISSYLGLPVILMSWVGILHDKQGLYLTSEKLVAE